MTQRHNSDDRRGAALILAITMLAVFAALGTLYVSNMVTENDRSSTWLREARARQVAEGGLRAALAQLREGVLKGQPESLAGRALRFDFPTYEGEFDGTALRLVSKENRKAAADVMIYDESGKANPNHLPASVLERILGVDGAAARAIASSLPGPANPKGKWLLSPDELVRRGLLKQDRFDKVRELLTTDTVTDHAHTQNSLNLNAASPDVLAAIADVPADKAKALAQRRPFSSLAALGDAAGKPPATFNIKPDPANPNGLPEPLALRSRCFRIMSHGVYARVEGQMDWRPASSKVEAVVLFNDDGTYEMVRWNAAR